jgi:hypothetical protein
MYIPAGFDLATQKLFSARGGSLDTPPWQGKFHKLFFSAYKYNYGHVSGYRRPVKNRRARVLIPSMVNSVWNSQF